MVIEMFNLWYFMWIVLAAGATFGLYFWLKNKKKSVQKMVLFALLVLGLALHFFKIWIPPYSENTIRMLQDSWFVNICGALIVNLLVGKIGIDSALDRVFNFLSFRRQEYPGTSHRRLFRHVHICHGKSADAPCGSCENGIEGVDVFFP